MKPCQYEPSDEYASYSSSSISDNNNESNISSEYKNRVGTKLCCSCERFDIEAREIDCLCCK